jgi:hypothetical protein
MLAGVLLLMTSPSPLENGRIARAHWLKRAAYWPKYQAIAERRDQILRLGLTLLNRQTRIAPTTTTNKIDSFIFAFPILSKHFWASVLIRVTNFPTPRRLPEWSIEGFRTALCGTLRKAWLRCAVRILKPFGTLLVSGH